MNLKDLRPSISEMSREEALQMILQIRESRVRNKRVIKERKKTEIKAQKKIELDLSKLSLEELEKLAEKLAGGIENGS